MEAGMGALIVFYIIFILGYLAVSIYCLVLFIKLATRGIKALDIYNNKKIKTEVIQEDRDE